MDYRQSLYLSLLDASRAHLLISEFSAKAYGTDVSPTSVFILDKLRENPDISITALAKFLQLNKSTISRTIAVLIKDNFLKEKPSAARKKTFHIAAAGRDFLNLHDQFNQNQIKKLSANLSKKEQALFAKYLWQFSDGLGAEAVKSGDTNRRILQAIRGISRGISLTSSLFGTKYSAMDWLCFSEIYYKNLSASQLAKSLNQPNSSVVQKLNLYKRFGFLRYVENKKDQRSNHIFLTKDGEKALGEIEAAARNLFTKALKNFLDQDLQEFISLLIKYIGVFVPWRAAQINDILISPLSDSESLSELRYFLAKNINSTYLLSENFFHPENLSFQLQKKGKLVGAIELTRKDKYEFCNFISKAGLDYADIKKSLAYFINTAEVDFKTLRKFY